VGAGLRPAFFIVSSSLRGELVRVFRIVSLYHL
jgi:hypothetical protein